MACSAANETTAIATSTAPTYDATSTSPSPSPPPSEEEPESDSGFFSSIFTKFSAIELENKGSVARDHLALERTFLAWLRTSLAFASIGIAITQLFRLNATLNSSDESSSKPGVATLKHMGKPLGATFLAIAILVLVIGIQRYYESQNWLLKGKFPASRGSVLLLTVVSGALIVTSLIIILAIAPNLTEP